MEFDWDDRNIDHIALHNVSPEEAEDAVLDPKRISFPAHSGNYGVIGQSAAGRKLVVIFTYTSSRVRVITARDLSTREKKSHKRRTK